ncbi:Ig-like domain-containing protein [Vallicoccus soli]|uniref:Ig-like domain-containing protein n=1 Tax=Vallicoccus soli TaxID=2339232 RepID=UPI00105A11C6|nr:Ig-like domain-containing protein [Vallicoccus soli]
MPVRQGHRSPRAVLPAATVVAAVAVVAAAAAALGGGGPGPTPVPPDPVVPGAVLNVVRTGAGTLSITPGSAGRVVAGSGGYHSVTWTAPPGGFTGLLTLRVPSGFGPGQAQDPTAPGYWYSAGSTCATGRPEARAPRAGAATVSVRARCGPEETVRLDVNDLRAPTTAGTLALLATVRADGEERATGVPGGATVRVVAASPERLVVSAPRRTPAGRASAEPVLVEVQDRYGNRVPNPDYVVGARAVGRLGPLPLAGERVVTTEDGLGALHGLLLPRESTGAALLVRGRPLQGYAPRLRGESAPFRVVGPPARLVVAAGDRQTAPAGSLLPARAVVRVLDRAGNPLPGVPVAFTATSGAVRASVPSGADGTAGTPWRLGPGGGPQRLTARAAGGPGTVLVATATGGLGALLAPVPSP